MTVSLKNPQLCVLGVSWALDDNMAGKRALSTRLNPTRFSATQSNLCSCEKWCPVLGRIWPEDGLRHAQGSIILVPLPHLDACRSTPGIYGATPQVGMIHFDYPIKRMQPAFQMHRNLTNLVALISPCCNFCYAIKILYTQMQWNACKSREIKNPFGCRVVFIRKTLTSWILKNAACCKGIQGS